MAEPTLHKPPSTGLISRLPVSWIPYAELMRLDRPGGFYALYVPCLFGIAYAVTFTPTPLPASIIIDRTALLLLCCLLARSAACTWNDLVDQDLDRKVARCRARPLARGDVTSLQAHIWALAQTATIITILLARLPVECTRYSVPIVALSILYPFAKRFTHYPQFILGLILSTGFLTGVHSLNVDPLVPATYQGTLFFFAANTIWTMIYDTIYAHQDVADDVHAGVKSMAVQFRHSTKPLIAFLSLLMILCLGLAGILNGLGPLYFASTVGGSALALSGTVTRVDLTDPRSCAWWFSWGFLFVGGSILGRFIGELGWRSGWAAGLIEKNLEVLR